MLPKREYCFEMSELAHAQKLILRSAFDEPDKALAHFDAWRRVMGFDRAGATEYRMLPLVYRNIGARIADPVAAARIRGVARQVWLSNQIRLDRYGMVLDALAA